MIRVWLEGMPVYSSYNEEPLSIILAIFLPLTLSLPRGSIVVRFWDYVYTILNINHEKKLLWSLWVNLGASSLDKFGLAGLLDFRCVRCAGLG